MIFAFLTNIFYICPVPSGMLHTDESVFAFILGRNLGNFDRIKDKQFIHHLVWCIVPFRHIAITGVGYCLFDTGFPEPLPDKRKMLHTFLLQCGPGAAAP